MENRITKISIIIIIIIIIITIIIIIISIYKLGDVGISSNLIGSLSLTNGHCPPPRRWIMKQWPAGVNSRFAEVTENDILRMQDNTIPNNTKEATKLGIKVFKDKQCFNTQFAYMSSVFCPDRQSPLLMPLSLNNNCPSTAPFQSPVQVNSTSIEQNISIQENLNGAIVFENDCDF